ncbi:Magnesium chelatase [Cymbomonas tetramitiformis]|uniref:Magnesium chelatase n=1 Tax=Cymbomonas tetramitiformis TaxID=36881 RepID=A0AAE0C156_9CHLO|nr:Magnesium chelatase [Cymbomonas tetramitiformis]
MTYLACIPCIGHPPAVVPGAGADGRRWCGRGWSEQEMVWKGWSEREMEFTEYTDRLYKYLQVVEGRLFSEGLHVLGSQPSSSQLEQYLGAYFGDDLGSVAVEAVANTRGGLDQVHGKLRGSSAEDPGGAGVAESRLAEAVEIRDLLLRNTEELESAVKALNGEFVLPAAGGDLLRDGPGVLPTGRNIHALDPYRMPSPAAMQRGSVIAENLLTRHQEAHDGALPETVAVALWGLDAIKTKGESVGIALTLIGARPVKESTGRIVRYELIPLEELGRPRVDVLCNMSGIFRDSFVNVVELLDDAFRRAAEADEPEEMNFVRKHAVAMAAEGLENSSARLFSNPAGDYGSMVNERVGAGNWDAGEELGSTWASRNSFSYGRGGEKGTARPEVLQKLLGTTEHIVQEIDSVEYGLTDIQEYYANTGALQRAASSAQGGKKVAASVVETFGKAAESKDLEAVLRLEYRSKLLNPKWAEAMAKQGSGGAFEISQRMTALVGWGATSDFTEDWVYDGAYETYVDDAAMREKLRKANPQAFQNVLKRMLEAAGRGMWNADEATLEKLKQEYMEMDDVLEGVRKA